MNEDFDNSIKAILQDSVDAVKSTHGGHLPSDDLILALCTRIHLAQKCLATEIARLNWMAQSYDEVGTENEEQHLAGYLMFERVFAKARKQGLSNPEAMRLAIDAGIGQPNK